MSADAMMARLLELLRIRRLAEQVSAKHALPVDERYAEATDALESAVFLLKRRAFEKDALVAHCIQCPQCHDAVFEWLRADSEWERSESGRLAAQWKTHLTETDSDGAQRLYDALKRLVRMYGPSTEYSHEAQTAWKQAEDALAGGITT